MNKKKLSILTEKLNACYQEAADIKKEIEKVKYSGINLDGKCLVKSVGLGKDYLYVERQSIEEESSDVWLTGLNFYICTDKKSPELAEVYFKGWQTWRLDIDEALNLRDIQVIDKITFMNEIKGYTKTLEIFINDWIDKVLSK